MITASLTQYHWLRGHPMWEKALLAMAAALGIGFITDAVWRAAGGKRS
ncbi:hypothetical protein AB0K00_29900 [Dactylosporangium sp. NPDC049525]